MKHYVFRGFVRDGAYINLAYSIDERNRLTCQALTPPQLAAFSAYILSSYPHDDKRGNSLKESTPEEDRLWGAFVTTLLVCADCNATPVLFNPYLQKWLCETHQTGIEE